MTLIKKYALSFSQGRLPLNQAVLLAVLSSGGWSFIYLLCIGIIHGVWLDAIIVDSFLNSHDGRWFYYEIISIISALPGYLLVLLYLWRCSENTPYLKYTNTIRIIIAISFLGLLMLSALLIFSVYAFGPAVL